MAAWGGPRLDREPDPAVTGDAAAAVPRGAPGLPPGVDCPIPGLLQAALQGSDAVQIALARIPRRSRSVANVVLLWHGQWVAADQVGGQVTIDSVRDEVALALQSAPEACRSQVVVGPVFLPLKGPTGDMVLALGSGAWLWTDLLANAPILPAAPDSSTLRREPAASK